MSTIFPGARSAVQRFVSSCRIDALCFGDMDTTGGTLMLVLALINCRELLPNSQALHNVSPFNESDISAAKR